MGKIRSALYRFMYGRYGTDTLGNVLLITYITIVVLHTLLTFFVESLIFDASVAVVSVALIIAVFGRMFSRNIAKRQKENQRFCGFFKLIKNKFRDRRTHVYRKCPKCRAVLRLPHNKGKHFVICPRCKNRFSVRG